MSLKTLAVGQLETLLRPLAAANRFPARPRAGWLRAIRTALGMTTRQMASRMGVSQRLVVDFEKREIAETISVASLRRAAHALDCDLLYVLMPRENLTARLEGQARAVARQKLRSIAHSMHLEDQGVSDSAMERQIEQLAQELIERRRRELWN